MNKQDTLALCEQFQIRPTKSLGQNFLINDSVSRRIAALADLSSADLVIEIGPGLGALTVELAAQAGKVVAIEIDHRLIPPLQQFLSAFSNVEIIEQDALKTDLRRLAESWPGPVKVAANLPYYITTPLIEKMLVELPQSECLILMLQQEAADRLLADPGSKQYSPLAILAAHFGKGEKAFVIPPDAFLPRPHVESCVVAIQGTHLQACANWPRYLRFLESCFAQRRKTLLNNLRTIGLTPVQMQAVRSLLANLGLPDGVRAEAIDARDFAALFRLCTDS